MQKECGHDQIVKEMEDNCENIDIPKKEVQKCGHD